MKKYTSIFPVLLILLFIVSRFPYEAKGQVEDRVIQGNWNGTLSFHEKYEGALIRSGSWNETMINVTITDNKGQGTMKIDGELIIGGKNMGRVSCTGEGVVMLYDVAIIPSEGTYRIVTTGPDCFNGTDLHSTGDVTIDYNYGGHALNVLSGTKTKVVQIPTEDGGTVTTTYRWYLVRSIDAELIVTPEGYDKAGAKKSYDVWLPEPGRDEVSLGSKMKINLRLQGKNGKPLSVKAESFELRLSNTSKEPGITLNAPLSPSAVQLPDLRFLEDNIGESIEEDQFIEIECDDGKTGTATIASYDGGGWTTLTVIAVLEDGSRIQGTLLTPTGVMEIPIPKRDPNSKIAIKWLNDNGNPGEMDDKDSSRGNNYKGDGYTAYEEYRGIINYGQFKRLNPKKKELGIVASRRNFNLLDEGISWFKSASDLEIIRFDIDRDEVDPDGRVNMNEKSDHDFDQYALYLRNGSLGGRKLGKVFSTTDNPGIPAEILMVVVDFTYILISYSKRVANMRPDVLKFSAREYLAQTVAHELGHAVNVWHHGEGSPYDSFTVRTLSDDDRIFDRNGNLITTRPIVLKNIGDSTGTVEGGDLSCMMNYYPYFRWGYVTGADGANIFNQEPLIPLGKEFCTSDVATDFNTRGLFFGKAAKGKCKKQIKLRD